MNCFIQRITNPRAVGINSKIALIKKMAISFRNREQLKTAMSFWHYNLNLYP
jgi:transposase